ncbi:MAG: S1 RNA-binding domain-containing protein [Lachnospiraceae bacterium]|nr:S1 RNA-binding domain-containing protein [Lachnospiraceae bacterium]
MIKTGYKQKLKVVKKVEFGVYLAEEGSGESAEERVLLPNSRVPEGTKIGSELEVFIYRDSEDRQIATLSEPALTIGGLARLKVVQVTKIGAFLSWGLEKDLFLPYAQQTYRVNEGDEILVTMYADKSDRLCAKMDVYKSLEDVSPYKKDDTVTGTLYLISNNFGAFVAVDDRYSALIPKKEMFGSAEKLVLGQKVTARVAKVMDDGRLQLAVRDKGYVQRNEDAEKIFALINESGGKIDFYDKSEPELIKERTGMSKNEFKRAVGKLLKEDRIDIGDGIITLRK